MTFTDSQLTEEKKLIWAGLKRAQSDFSAVASELNIIRNNIDWATFQGHHDAYDLGGDGSTEDISTFTQFKQYLNEEHGFDTSQQDHFVEKIRTAFTDEDSSGTEYDEYEAFVESAGSYAELENKFGSVTTFSTEQTTEEGEPVAGIRVHDTAGVSYAGVSVEAGTTEVFGRRIEFSQQDPPRAEDGTISYSNLRTDDADNVVAPLVPVEISADVTNTNSGDRRVTVSLTRDGSVVQESTVDVDAGATVTVSFTERYNEYVCYEYSIGGLSPITVCWAPSGLTGF